MLLAIFLSLTLLGVALAVSDWAFKRHPSILRLPRDLVVWVCNEFEGYLLHYELFESNTYLRHGVTLPPSDAIVLDVGANIGMFSVSLATAHRLRRLRVVAFEPNPAVVEVLEKNLARHLPASGGHRVELMPIGLADCAVPSVEFTHDPFSTVGISVEQSLLELKLPGVRKPRNPLALAWYHVQVARRFLAAGMRDFSRTGMPGLGFLVPFARLLSGGGRCWEEDRELLGTLGFVIALPLLYIAVIMLPLRSFLSRRRVRASLRPLDDVLRELDESGFLRADEQVDLLKIDCEGHELKVLEGLSARNLARVRQLVIETHDIENRVAYMSNRLREAGFNVVVDVEGLDVHRMFSLQTIYAVRK